MNALFPFQADGHIWISDKLQHQKGIILADEQGLGKTVQSLAWLADQDYDAFPVLVVPKSSAKLKWGREAQTWVEGARIKMLFGTLRYRDLSKYDIIVCNWDILADHFSVLNKNGFRTGILDEIQMMKNDNAVRTYAAMELLKPMRYGIGLSGTPIDSRPDEFWNAIVTFGPWVLGAGNTDKLRAIARHRFRHRYCGAKQDHFGHWDYSGASNTKELHDLLVQTIMLRRLKKDIYPQLPKIQYDPIPLDFDRTQYEKEMSDFDRWMAVVGKRFAQGGQGLTRLTKAKHACARAKLASAIEWIDDFLESGNKLVVFGWHVDIMDTLEKRYKKICIRIAGDPIQKDRAMLIFQNEKWCKLALGNYNAAGDSIELTAASDVAFIEFPWIPTTFHQCEARVYARLNDMHGAMIHVLFAPHTVEESNVRLLTGKENVVSSVLDGTEGEVESVFRTIVQMHEEGSFQ